MWLPALAFGFLLAMSGVSLAQDGPVRASTTPPAEPGEAIEPQPGDTIWVLGPNGKPVPVPGLTIQEIREFLRLKQTPQEKPSEFYVGKMTATGVVANDMATAMIDLEIDVIVNVATPVRVPMRLSEGTLLKQSYQGDGAIAVESPARLNELVCWFTGKGTHTVTLSLSVNVRKTPAGYRILLSLPNSVVSSLELKFPRGDIQVRPASPDTKHETTKVNNNESLLQAHQLGTAIDLTWQEVVGQNVAQAELQTQTLIEAHVEADDVRLEVTQTVGSQGSFREIFVKMPSTFFVSDITDANFPDLTWEVGADKRIRVDPGTATNRLDLKWIITTKAIDPDATANNDEKTVTVSGLIVEGASRQDGLIGLTVSEGFNVAVSQARSLRRLGISSFRRLAGARIQDTSKSFRYAWQFENRAFQVSLKRERIASSFAVRPQYKLMLGESEKPEATLTATFDLQVFRGKIDRIQLFWPNFQQEGWGEPVIIEPKSGAEAILPGTARVKNGEGKDLVTLVLQNSISRSEAQSIELHCSRPISLEQVPIRGEETFALTLPVPVSQRQADLQLTVENGGNIVSSLEPIGGASVTVLASLPSDSFAPQNTHERVWEVSAERLEFAAKVEAFEQRTTCETTVTATISDESCMVEQVFDYEVLYRQLNEVRLLVPGNRTPQFWLLRPQDNERRPLAPQLTGVEVDDRVQFRLDLSPDLWGQFQIIAQYELRMPAKDARLGGEVELTLPMLSSSDAPAKQIHLEINSADNLRVVPQDDSRWKPELRLSRLPGWVTEEERPSVPLSLSFLQERAEQNFTIRRAVVETRFLPTPRSQAAYVIDGDVSFLTMQFPPSVDLSRRIIAWWDGEELSAQQFRRVSQLSREFAINTRDLPAGSQHVLAVEFDSATETSFGAFNNLALAAPRFAPDVWLAETQWNVVLPVDQHLSVYPDHYSPRFTWQLQNILWDRRPVPGQLAQGHWLLEDVGGAPLMISGDNPRQLVPFDWFGGAVFGNAYRFSSFGVQHEIHFHSMSQPAIMLCGAGFALAVGFILLRIPATRHMLTLLGLGCGMAILALWRPEPVQLLLQPALFGLLLAVVAAILENRSRRSQQASLVTLSSPDDFLADSDADVPLHVERPVEVEEPAEDGSAA